MHRETTSTLPLVTLQEDKRQWRKKFSEKLQELMEKQHISKYKLADKTGLTPMCIHYYLVESSMPSAFTVARIAKALNCSVNDLIVFE